MNGLRSLGRAATLVAVIALSVTGASKKHPYSPHEKAFFADEALVDFVLPGLNITINSAKIASNGTISVIYTLTDPTGLPLDASGATTPGAVSLAYVAAYVSKGRCPGSKTKNHEFAQSAKAPTGIVLDNRPKRATNGTNLGS